MGLLLFVIFIVVPIVELYVILQVADAIGVLETVALLIVVAIAGSWLVKQQGVAAWGRFRRTLQEGRVPTDEISDGALIMFGGALLLTPGFVTDALGLVLLFPPTRLIVKKAAGRRMRARIGGVGGTRSRGPYEARVVKIERDPTRPKTPRSDPSDERPAALGDDSPDKG